MGLFSFKITKTCQVSKEYIPFFFFIGQINAVQLKYKKMYLKKMFLVQTCTEPRLLVNKPNATAVAPSLCYPGHSLIFKLTKYSKKPHPKKLFVCATEYIVVINIEQSLCEGLFQNKNVNNPN